MIRCNRCDQTGFLNIDQIPGQDFRKLTDVESFVRWIKNNKDHDVSICDCCGDGESWHGEAGNHYGPDDPRGHDGPYAYNGGLCECH